MNKNSQIRSQNELPPLRLTRVVERMVAELGSGVSLEALATESGYSRNHFLRMFKAATGCTPYQYFLRLRIKKAQELMEDRSMPLIEIALACGFSSHAHLSRVFRSVIGATPSDYRRDRLQASNQAAVTPESLDNLRIVP
jgi:AraC family transcriptional regulator